MISFCEIGVATVFNIRGSYCRVNLQILLQGPWYIYLAYVSIYIFSFMYLVPWINWLIDCLIDWLIECNILLCKTRKTCTSTHRITGLPSINRGRMQLHEAVFSSRKNQHLYSTQNESCAKEYYSERSVKMNANTSSNIPNVGLKFENCFLRPIVHSPSSSYIKNHIAICVVNTLFSIVGTILNSLVLYIFWKSPQQRTKMSSFVIMVLSSIDLGVVTIVQPLFISFLINEILETSKLCLRFMAFVLLEFLFHGMCISTLLTINIQRYLSIVRPIWHRNVATKKRFLLTSLFIWFIYIFISDFGG